MSTRKSVLSVTGKRPADLGVRDGRLKPCPKSPNCVGSDCDEKRHAIEPLALGDHAPGEAWEAVKAAVRELPRSEIVTETDDYLHAESKSAFWGFGDDLELHFRPDDGVIAVRCAARLGYSDFGANRRRVEALRTAFGAALKCAGGN